MGIWKVNISYLKDMVVRRKKSNLLSAPVVCILLFRVVFFLFLRERTEASAKKSKILNL